MSKKSELAYRVTQLKETEPPFSVMDLMTLVYIQMRLL